MESLIDAMTIATSEEYAGAVSRFGFAGSTRNGDACACNKVARHRVMAPDSVATMFDHKNGLVNGSLSAKTFHICPASDLWWAFFLDDVRSSFLLP